MSLLHLRTPIVAAVGLCAALGILGPPAAIAAGATPPRSVPAITPLATGLAAPPTSGASGASGAPGASSTASTSAATAATNAANAANAATAGGEQVEIELPPSVVFQVYDVRGGPVTARAPFSLAWRGARLVAGNTLRISVRLETPDARLAFRGSGPRGGTCGNGHLTPGAFIRVFDGAAGATSGGCDLLWQLDTLGTVKRSGRYAVALRWKIESVGLLAGFGTLASPPGAGSRGSAAAAAAAAAANPPTAAGPAAAAHSASGLPFGAAAIQAAAAAAGPSHGPPPPMPRRAPPG